MSFSEIGPTQVLMMVAVILLLSAAIAVWAFASKRKTQKLQAQFGSAEYNRTVKAGGSRRQAESSLEKRAERVDNLHIQPLAPADRARFIDSWARVQAQFVDGPGIAVTEADKLLGDVMSTRGYPMSDFEQRAADISVDHPLVLDNYRAAHQGAMRQTRGEASTEDLRKAMIHFRTLFDELVREPQAAHS
ncbi:MAG TPA: hypothetical protein VK728_02240 [Candidatus Sulfotelmatobacter sp.]|jgi:hypothetical protein|nr:hypothetical protein [Candidatus Sulfotelmatobacter sp.]